MLAAQRKVDITFLGLLRLTLPRSCVYSAPDVPNPGILCSIRLAILAAQRVPRGAGLQDI